MPRVTRPVLVLGVALLVAGGFPLAVRVPPARAADPFVVNSTADRGDKTPGDGSCLTGVTVIEDGGLLPECALRAAIQEANAFPGADTVRFGISGGGVHTISPASQLPPITGPLVIDGYSQPGASANTAAIGTNAVLKIVLDGSKVGSAVDGLVVTARDSTVKGLVINNGFRFGVVFDAATPSGAGRRLEGCFVGTDVSGTAASGTRTRGGVVIDDGEGNVVGGDTPAARNLISGTNDTGVFLTAAATGNRVEGNLIGTRRDGTTALGNGLTGVHILGGSDNVIGGNGAARNTIAFNGHHGVHVQAVVAPGSGTGNRILQNSIYENGELGINLGADAVTPNDRGDGDTGANGLQNFPTIASAVTSGGSTTVTGRLNSAPNRTFTIQFFGSPGPQTDPSGFGEGRTFLGQRSVTTNANGNASFEFVSDRLVPVANRVTATATNGGGNTSEFSNARIVVRPIGR